MESVGKMIKLWTVSKNSKLFDVLCPKLFSHAVSALSNILDGHTASYFSNNRRYANFLFTNFSVDDDENGILCKFNMDPTKRLHTGSCHISNDQVSLTFADGRSVKCKARFVCFNSSLIFSI
jgi:hypothetical protein